AGILLSCKLRWQVTTFAESTRVGRTCLPRAQGRKSKSTMKIVAVESVLASIPYKATGSARRVAGQAAPGLNMLLVKVTTESGLVGWGEAFGHAVAPGTKAVLDTLVAPLLVGRDARDIGGLMSE